MPRVHRHSVMVTIAVLPYVGALRERDEQVEGAHGHMTLVQLCTCGATRSVNVNAPAVEEGAWHVHATEPIF